MVFLDEQDGPAAAASRAKFVGPHNSIKHDLSSLGSYLGDAG
jgi:hypothetical protein